MKKILRNLLVGAALTVGTLHAPPVQADPVTAAFGFEILANGIGVWTFQAGGHWFGVAAATEAEAVAMLNSQGAVRGLFYLGGPSTGSAGAAGGTAAGGTVLGTLGILAGAGLVAVASVIAIDCYAHGECIWTTVNNAGGWGQVLGIGPNVNAQPIPGAVTVSCSDPTPLATQCRASSLRNQITDYWNFGTYTCGDIWDDGTTSASDAWNRALANCNALVDLCVANTSNVCQVNNIPRLDVQPVAVAAPVLE